MLVLDVGQCGIQVGSAFTNFVHDQVSCSNTSTSNTPTPTNTITPYPFNTYVPVLIDTEHKTWSKQISNPSNSAPSSSSRYVVDCGRCGRGNVWSYGFHTNVEKLMNVLRKVSERDASVADSLLLVHSIAGGTGSGLGSRLLEELRDTYPKKALGTCSIIPFLSGESPLQFYNSLLTLTWSQTMADFVGVFSNDEVLNLLRKSGSGNSSNNSSSSGTRAKGRSFSGGNSSNSNSSGSNDNICIREINEYIAACMGGVFSPIDDGFSASPSSTSSSKRATSTSSSSSSYQQYRCLKKVSLWDIIPSVTPLPSRKLATFATASISNTSADGSHKSGRMATLEKNEWEYLSNEVERKVWLPGHKPKVFGSQVYIRGVDDEWLLPSTQNGTSSYDENVNSMNSNSNPSKLAKKKPQPLSFYDDSPLHAIKKLQSKFYAHASQLDNPFPVDTILSGTSYSSRRSMTVLQNSTSISPMLQTIYGRSKEMFDSRAYLHWYERFCGSGSGNNTVELGMDVGEMFKDAFDVMHGVCEAYT